MKKHLYKNSFFCLLVVCITALISTTSCETEYNTIYNDIPGETTYVSGDAYIKSFTIQEFEDQEPMQASIVGDTIKILWVSYYEMPQTITPTIQLADHATISPSSATEIEFKDGETYVVTSEAGTTKEYILEVDFRQPQPKTFTMGYKSEGFLGGWYGFNIDNVWYNLDQTRVYLVSAADQTTEYDCEIVYFGLGTGVSPFKNEGLYFYYPTDIPVGKYDLRIKNGEYILRDANEEHWFNFDFFESTELQVSGFMSQTETPVVIGNEFTLRGVKLDLGNQVLISRGTNGTRYPLEIINRTSFEATFRVPEGTPVNVYNRLWFVSDNGDEVRSGVWLTITE